EVVDTTGAGDAFVAGFAVGLAWGWPPDIAVRLGCSAGAESVRRPGAQASYPDPASAAALAAAVAPGNGRAAGTADVAARGDPRP
ncbi:MAG TPA: PfkB family carbohydrate kinase, partial [Candidatus Deferrimicrobium sp.]|nr:PfkB family carbohydrate kinase [Candidatus Deferrimicrobium sp.]